MLPRSGKAGSPLIMHGDDDQIVPIGAAALLSSKLVKDRVNQELVAVLQGSADRATAPGAGNERRWPALMPRG